MSGGELPDEMELDFTLVVPALNEERNIVGTLRTVGEVARALPGRRLEAIVIDDGSSDRTAEIVAAASAVDPRIRLVRHPRNRGLGASLRSGLAAARGRQLLIVPGDNDLPASAILELLGRAHRADLVMCFFVNGEKRGRKRQALSSVFGLIYTLTFDIFVQYLNGPCVYPVGKLRQIEIHSDRFSIISEINVKLLRRGVTFHEVASYRQTGLDGSTSFSWRNLQEIATGYFRLCHEVLWKNRANYSLRPVRVVDEAER